MPDTQPTTPWDPATAAGIAQAPTQLGGQPGAPDSIAAMMNPIPFQVAPPASPQEETARVEGWSKEIEGFLQSPQAMLIGYALMNGAPIGNALLASQMYKMFEEQNALEEERAQQVFEMEQAKTQAELEGAKARTEQARAGTEQTKVQTEQARYNLEMAPELHELEKSKIAADIAQSRAAAASSGASAASAMAALEAKKYELAILKAKGTPEEIAAKEEEVRQLEIETKRLDNKSKELENTSKELENKSVRETGLKPGTAAGGGNRKQMFDIETSIDAASIETMMNEQSMAEWLDQNPDVEQKILAKSGGDPAKYKAAVEAAFAADPVAQLVTSNNKRMALAKARMNQLKKKKE